MHLLDKELKVLQLAMAFQREMLAGGARPELLLILEGIDGKLQGGKPVSLICFSDMELKTVYSALYGFAEAHHMIIFSTPKSEMDEKERKEYEAVEEQVLELLTQMEQIFDEKRILISDFLEIDKKISTYASQACQ